MVPLTKQMPRICFWQKRDASQHAEREGDRDEKLPASSLDTAAWVGAVFSPRKIKPDESGQKMLASLKKKLRRKSQPKKTIVDIGHCAKTAKLLLMSVL